ncbi:MAG TPA: sulfate ABC transporter substrate-binding protein [Nostocaceae cyanobacterium]|nr:sulfate ABC transporter substrate-binding protein [Nostocaceae cyanobacterium]
MFEQFICWQRYKYLLGKSRYVVFLLIVIISLTCNLLITACASNKNLSTVSSSNETQILSYKRKPIELSIVSYAVTRAAYANIIPLFQKKWQQEQQQEVRFRLSNAGSSTQARAVVNGLAADVVHLALALDINYIEKAGLIQPGWEKEMPNHSIVTSTVGAIVTRTGNPKNIRTWSDLGKPGVTVVTADPKTSGIARWNFLAFWGSVTQTGGTETQALDFVTKVYRNVLILAKDARDATDIFLRRKQGDVLINYENELIRADQEGLAKDTYYQIPQVNISIDNPIALVDKYVDRRGTREVAEAFVKFLYTKEAQREFAKVGFRPLEKTVFQEFAHNYPPIQKLFTVEDLGGWNAVQEKFFKDGRIFDQIQLKIKN